MLKPHNRGVNHKLTYIVVPITNVLVWVIHRAIVDRGATQGGFSRHLPSAPPIM